jgi:hypothetical protein
LAEEGLDTAITLKRQRTTKKDANKERWLKLQADATYQYLPPHFSHTLISLWY